MSQQLKVLAIGDVFGSPGRKMLAYMLPELRQQFSPDLVVANCENAAGGFGLTRKVVTELFSMGVDVITGGNHIWDKKEILNFIDAEPALLRPANYPPGVPGRGVYRLQVNDVWVGVISLTGRVFMGDYDCPFRAFDAIYKSLASNTDCIIVDFHGEATSEKIAFGLYVDGKASLVVGTHTHVATADERILPRGTAYITDIGMCGPADGVLGVDKDKVLYKFLTQLPTRFDVAKGPCQLSGVVCAIRAQGKSETIQRIYYTKII